MLTKKGNAGRDKKRTFRNEGLEGNSNKLKLAAEIIEMTIANMNVVLKAKLIKDFALSLDLLTRKPGSSRSNRVSKPRQAIITNIEIQENPYTKSPYPSFPRCRAINHVEANDATNENKCKSNTFNNCLRYIPLS